MQAGMPTGVLFGQIFVVLGIALACLWGGTQWTAAALGYQAQLGAPWFHFAGLPYYHPWDLFWWWYAYDAYAPVIFMRGGIIAALDGILAAALAIGMSVWRARQSRRVTTYGSARWATREDITRAGFTRSAGVFLGRVHDRKHGKTSIYLRHDGPEHVMAIAPTRSGKGVGLVVPTLLSWPASCVVHDIKGENWASTAGWRSRFSHCLLFNPTDVRSAAYNPLLEVRRGANEVRDIQNVADILVDPEGMLSSPGIVGWQGDRVATGGLARMDQRSSRFSSSDDVRHTTKFGWRPSTACGGRASQISAQAWVSARCL